MNNKKLKHKYFLTKNNFEQLSDLNAEFFESAKLSLLDPLGLYLANDVKWIKLNQNWNSLKFPVVMGGKGQPILLLHGFDSSFLEFRRIYKSLKRNFQVIVPDLLGFGFSPRCATNEYNSSKIISHLIDLLKTLKITKNLKIIGASMGGSTALKLAYEIPDSIDQIGASFLGLPQVRKSLCRQAFAFPDECVGKMEEQIASIHLGCKGWRNSLASFAKSGGFAGTQKYIQNIPTKTLCGENDRILGKKEIKKIGNIEKLNFVGLQNCGHLPHIDLPSLSSKIIQDYFLE